MLEAAGESETLVRRVDRWTREARSRRAPVEIAADRFVARFVPGVALIALASALAWGLVGGDCARAASPPCPCSSSRVPALSELQRPMATTIAITRAAGRGTLLRSGAVLEALDRIRLAAFDKTGTITRGRAAVRAVRIDPAADDVGGAHPALCGGG